MHKEVRASLYLDMGCGTEIMGSLIDAPAPLPLPAMLVGVSAVPVSLGKVAGDDSDGA